MAHNFAINTDVHHQLQGPQGRAVIKERSVYTIVTCLPIEADGRPRYRIKSKSENIERVVTNPSASGCYFRRNGVNASHSNNRFALLIAPKPALVPKTSLKSDQARARSCGRIAHSRILEKLNDYRNS